MTTTYNNLTLFRFYDQLNSMAEHYNFEFSEILEELYDSFKEYLELKLKKEIIIQPKADTSVDEYMFLESFDFFDIYTVSQYGELIPVDKEKVFDLKGFKMICYIFERKLKFKKFSILLDSIKHKKLIRGVILDKDKENNLFVRFKVGEDYIIGKCNVVDQVKKERESDFYEIGKELYFYQKKPKIVTRLDIYLHVYLSRNSISLPKYLLKKYLYEKNIFIRFKVLKRISGKITFIKVEKLIPKEIIKKLEENLNEKVIVKTKFDKI